MKIALFGGSFDPPHKGHILVAQTLISLKYVDEVWFVPCAVHPFQKSVSSAQTRREMLERIPGIKISSYELDKEGRSYSIETLEHFAQIHPEHEFSWVMGSDQLETFTQWHRYQDILAKFHVFVYPRKSYPKEPLLPGMTLLEGVDELEVSSTEVRDQVVHHQDISTLTELPVAEYISQQHVYER